MVSVFFQLFMVFTFVFFFTDEEQKEKFRTGVKMWEDTTCMTFEEHEKNSSVIETQAHIRVWKGSGCSSHVGRLGPGEQQNLSLADGCFRVCFAISLYFCLY